MSVAAGALLIYINQLFILGLHVMLEFTQDIYGELPELSFSIWFTNVLGFGMQKGHTGVYRGVPVQTRLLPKVQADIVISKVPTDALINTIKSVLYTGNVGDGKSLFSMWKT